jgi:hypothetical protein
MNKSYLIIALLSVCLLASVTLTAQTFIQIGSATTHNGAATDDPTPYGTYYKNFRQQYLYTASEIRAAGGRAGNITSLGFYIFSLNGITAVPSYTIRLKHTTQNVLSTTFETGTYTQVWRQLTYAPTNTAWVIHTLDTPFAWDGTSNLLIDIVTTMAAIRAENASVNYTATSIFNYSSLRFQSNIEAAINATTGVRSLLRANLKMVIYSPPEPADYVGPGNGGTAFCNTSLRWSPNGGPITGYKLYLGTDGEGTSTPTNIVNGTNLGNVTSYSPSPWLPVNATYYWKIVPFNSSGDAPGCPIWSFTTVPLSGNINVGLGSPLSTLTSAIELLNFSGVAASGVNFKLADQNFAEITPAITASGTEAGRIVFEPITESANPLLNLTSVTGASYGIKLDGADYVTIDDIDVTGPNTIQYGYWLTGGATHNNIQNCTISLRYNASPENSAIYSFGANDYCLYAGNIIDSDTYYDIRLDGDSVNNNSHNMITGNYIPGAGRTAIQLKYTTDTDIAGNNITIMAGCTKDFQGIWVYDACNDIEIFSNIIAGTSTQLVYGIYISSGVCSVHHNTLNGLHSTFTDGVTGIRAQAGNAQIYSNYISNLDYTGTLAYRATGIYLGGINNDAFNNMIYGIGNPNGTISPQIYGIMAYSWAGSYICNNTIYLNAEGTVADFSSAGIFLGPSTDIHLQSNIVVNLSIPGSAGFTSALYSPSGTLSILGSETDKNIYYCGTPDATHLIGKFNSVDYSTLAEYKAAAGTVDQGSYTELTPFLSMTDPIDVHIDLTAYTIAEGNAIPQSWLASDIDGDPRNAETPDIGADEGEFLSADCDPTTALLPLDTTNALCNVTLNWNPATGYVTGYKLYLGTDGEGTSTPTNLVNGEILGNVTIYIPPSYLPVYATYYWMIVPYNPLYEAEGCPIWRFQAIPLSGTLYIGPGLDFLDFTTAISVLNFGGTYPGSGVTFKVDGMVFAETPPFITCSGTETGRIVFEASSGADNPVLSIAAGTRSYGFKLQGADYVTFDNIDVLGTNELTYGYLLTDAATHNIIQNCTITIPYNGATENCAVYSTGYNDDCSYLNNIINGNTFNGMVIEGGTSHTLNNLIQGNQFTQATRHAILLEYTTDTVVAQNQITIAPGNNLYFLGIHVLNTCAETEIWGNTITGTNAGPTEGMSLWGSCNVHNNDIINLQSTYDGYLYGINCWDGNKQINANRIYNLTRIVSTTYPTYGIFLNGGTNNYVSNNMISSLTNPYGTVAPQVEGMYISTSMPSFICNNTIDLYAPGTASNYSVVGMQLSLSAHFIMQNNIIVVYGLPGSSGFVSALYSSTGSISILSAGSDRNIYYGGTPDYRHFIAKFNGVSYPTLAEYKTAAATVDQGSYSEIPPIESESNLHLYYDPMNDTYVEGGGIPIAWLTQDYDGDARDTFTPDIGADEAHTNPYTPGAPVLLTPADSSTEFAPGTPLTWKANTSGGVPSGYAVHFGTSNPLPLVGTVEALSFLPTVAFGTTYSWYVTGANESGQTNSATWSFTTVDDPTIVSLPHSQNFDSVTAPVIPYGWVGYKSIPSMTISTVSSTFQTSPNCIYMYNSNNTIGVLQLVSPLVTVPMHSFIVNFYARASANGQTIKVGTTDLADGSGAFTEIASLSLTTSFAQYSVPFAGYSGPDQYICFQHGMGVAMRVIYLDTVYLEEAQIAAPQNVRAVYSGGVCSLQWDTVEGAVAYMVYGSLDPYADPPWSYIGTVAAPETEYPLTITEPFRFYYVTAWNGARR